MEEAYKKRLRPKDKKSPSPERKRRRVNSPLEKVTTEDLVNDNDGMK